MPGRTSRGRGARKSFRARDTHVAGHPVPSAERARRVACAFALVALVQTRVITAKPHLRSGAIRWATLVFLIVFTGLLIAVTSYVLVPGFEAIKDPALTPEEKRSLQAWYRLLMFVLLFILFAGVVLTFRFGRFFFPRATAPRTQTQYVDAWAESARRMQVPKEEESEDGG